MLLATNNSHQAESDISRFISKYDMKDVKRADDDGGVLYCGQRIRTVPDDVKPGGLSLQQDQTEFVKARCEPERDKREHRVQPALVTGGTRPDESFATSQLQRKQAAPLVFDHNRAVQTVKRLRGQPEIIGLRFGPLSTGMCVVVHTDSALHNADADTDDEGSDDEWLAGVEQKGIRVPSQHGALVCVVAQDDLEKNEVIPMSFMTWKSKASKGTILSTYGAEASACRDALDLAEYTRAMLCEVLSGARVLPDEWTEEHLPVRVITDCQSLFDCLAKDASVPEDRGTALTVAPLRERCLAGVGRDTKRSRLMWVPTRAQLADGLTKSSAGVFLRNALTSGTAQLHEASTKVLKRNTTNSPAVREKFETSRLPKWILSRNWWQ